MMMNLNNYLPTVGIFTGMIAGGISNLWKSHSIFELPDSCKNHLSGIYFVDKINEFRDREYNFSKDNILTPSAFNYLYPAVHIIPMLAFSVFNTVMNHEAGQTGITSFLKRGWHQLSNNVMYPILNSAGLLVISELSRYILNTVLLNKVDISGHALNQMILTLHAVKSLQGISSTGAPVQKKIYTAFCLGAVGLSDAIFMFNNINYCHSVMDVALAVTIVASQHIIAETAIMLF